MENWLQFAYQRVKEVHGEAIQRTFGVKIIVPTVPFPRIAMSEAVEILKTVGYRLPPDKKGDLDPGGERAIAQYVKEKFDHDFVFLTDWPITVRPFYHMRHPTTRP
jgi:aspartyl/asparaginyl-tRNA synthetase